MKQLKSGVAGVILMGFASVSWGVAMDADRVLSLTISQEGLTRLSVKDDKIEDLFVYPVEAAPHIQLHTSGHVFITPEGFAKPLSVTVMTVSGKTQDLRLTFSKKPAGPLYLEAKEPVPPPLSLTPVERSAEEILSDFVFQGISAGFDACPVQESPREVAGALYTPTRSWCLGKTQVTLFEGASSLGKGEEVPLSQAKRPGDVLLGASLSQTPRSFFVVARAAL